MKRAYSRKFLLGALAGASALASTAAHAQSAEGSSDSVATQGDQASEGAQSSDGFTDIVVTARRRAERLQDVPIAVSAISGDDLASKSVVQLQDLTRTVPALNVTPGGFGSAVPRFTIRSQTQFEQLLTLDPSVGVYFADVAQARAHGVNAGFFDIASVEVLKGPQGTLFGRNTTGGAIVITPNAATDELGGYARMTLGNYALTTFEGAVNFPITEGLSLRLAGRIADRKGYTRNIVSGLRFDDEDSTSWRASARWEPFDGFTNTLVVNGFKSNEQGPGWRLTGVAPGSIVANVRGTDVATFLALVGDRRVVGSDIREKQTQAKAWGLSNITTIDVGAITIKNIFGYRDVHSTNRLDFDGSSLDIWPSFEQLNSNQYSNEFQILGTAFEDKLDWILGAYYFREKGDDTQRSTIKLAPTLSQDVIRTGFVTNLSKSLFAQGTYEILDGLSFTAGGRYTWDERKFQQQGRNLLTGNCSILTAAGTPIAQPCIGPQYEAEFGAFTYTLSADYKFGPNQLVYIAHRKGYRAGGFNLRANTVAQFQPFAPEFVRDLEIGVKADWDIGGTQLRTNIAGYYQWYSDIQRNVTLLPPGSNILLTTIFNAATAHVPGFEADVTWIPTKGLEISGFVANSKLTYDKFEQSLPGGGVQDLSANRIAFAPKWSGGGSIRYETELSGGNGSVAAQADFYSQSEVELQDLNVPNGTAAGYTVTNLRLEWNDFLGSQVSVAAYLRNAFAEKYFTSGVAVPNIGVITKIFGAPGPSAPS